MKFILIYSLLWLGFSLNAQTKADTLFFNQLQQDIIKLNASAQAQEALVLINKGLEEAKRKDNKIFYADFLNLLSLWHQKAQNFEEADRYNHALIDFQEKNLGKTHILYASALNNRALLYQAWGKLASVDSFYQIALSVYENTNRKNVINYATTLNNYAIYQEEVGNYQAAEELYLAAVEAYRNIDSTDENYANALGNLGTFCESLGKYQEAEWYILECIALNKRRLGEDYPYKSTDLNNLAFVYLNWNKLKEAERLFLEVLALDAQLGTNTSDYAGILSNLTSLYDRMGEYDKAEFYLDQATAIVRRIYGERHPRYANVMLKYSSPYLRKGKIAELKALNRQTLAIYVETYGPRHYDVANVLLNMAEVFLEEQKLDSVQFYLQAAFNAAVLDEEDIPQTVWQDLSRLGGLDYQDFGYAQKLFSAYLKLLKASYRLNPSTENLEAINALSRGALQYNERFRRNLSQEGDQLEILRHNNQFVRVAVATNLGTSTEMGLAQAFEFLEQNKSILLASSLQSRQHKQISHLPDSILNREVALLTEINTLQNEYLQQSKQERAGLRSKLNALNLELDQIKQLIQKLDPNYYQLKYEHRSISLAETQALLAPDALLLTYLVGDSALYLLAIDQKNIRSYSIPIQADSFAAQMSRFRYSLSSFDYIKSHPSAAYTDYTSHAYACYRDFVAPALNDAPQAKHLIIIPDKQLTQLPFEAFLTSPAPEQANTYTNLPYLIRTYQVSYAYSATLLKENQLAAQNQAFNAKLLAIAADYELALEDIESAQRLSKKYSLRRSLQPLPAAKAEAQQIAKTFGTSPYLGEQAGEAFFKTEASNYGIIHLAMHGLLNQKHPALSALAFSELGDEGEDNFLQAHEIARLPLKAQLVVLSACETAGGKYEQGEGVMSLGRAFMYAGVPTLLSSLWAVNDASTALLMTNFYQALHQGQSPAQALQQAKLDYLAGADDLGAHPIFWAAFVQTGANEPIRAKPYSSWLWLGLFALGLGLILGYAFMRYRKS